MNTQVPLHHAQIICCTVRFEQHQGRQNVFGETPPPPQNDKLNQIQESFSQLLSGKLLKCFFYHDLMTFMTMSVVPSLTKVQPED